MTSIMTRTDSYKVSHAKQYPPGTEKVYSYFESRGMPAGWRDGVVFFGLQYYLKKYLNVYFTQLDVDMAEQLWNAHLGPGMFNKEGWQYILDKHRGRLPVSIKAVPEGSVVPFRNVMMTVENTDPEVPWLTNWLETILCQLWYTCTVATQSREMKRRIKRFLDATGDPEGLPFKLHDFGYRGVSSQETAALGGAAHLVNFQGTDTFAGCEMAMEYYRSEMPGFSIPASEHSTITSWGKENELAAFKNMLDTYPSGLVACVSDSYDIYNACEKLWPSLKKQIMGRDGTLVVRPDSGNPVLVVLSVLKLLGEQFGYETNDKGYKVLPPQLRVIQGDGIDISSMCEILENMERQKWSADNIAFGSGGGLLQKLDRDTLQFAFKCSNITVNGEDRDVFKDPATDPGKHSKRGKMKLVRDRYKDEKEQYATVPLNQPGTDQLVEVFRDGEILVEHTFDEVRKRAEL